MDIAIGLNQVFICDMKGKIQSSGYLWSNKGDYMEVRGESFQLFEQGEKIKVIVQHQNGRREIISAYVCISQEKYLSLLVLCKKIYGDQRSFFRVATQIKSEIIFELYQDKTIPLAQKVDICIMNISLDGMLIGTNEVLTIGKTYKASVILNNNIVDLTFKIARKIKSEKWGNEYGCKFIKKFQNCERDICQYIFEVERRKKASAQNVL